MKRKIPIVLGLLLAAIALFAAVQVFAQTPTADQVNDVAKELYCPLCAGITVDVCETQQCVQMRNLIREKLAAGETKEEIKQYFIEQYGQRVVAAPAKRGLGLAVWILPFVALLLGLGWGAYMLRNWASQRQGPPTPGTAAAGALPEKYLQQLEQELEETD